MFRSTRHSALPLQQMLLLFRPFLLQLVACFSRGKVKETDWPLQGPKPWGNSTRVASPLSDILRLPTAPRGKVRPRVCIQRKNTGLRNHVDRWRRTLLCLQRKTWNKNVLLLSTLEGAAACQSCYSEDVSDENSFGHVFILATETQDKCNRKGTISNENL